MTNTDKPNLIYVHFICTGNAYRSRLAEAYMKSKKIKNLKISSSGLEAKNSKHDNGPASWYTIRLAQKHNLLKHLKPLWTQTTTDHFYKANMIVFMHPIHLEKSQAMFGYDGLKHITWNIPDLSDLGFTNQDRDIADEFALIEATEVTFTQIRERVNELCEEILSINK